MVKENIQEVDDDRLWEMWRVAQSEKERGYFCARANIISTEKELKRRGLWMPDKE